MNKFSMTLEIHGELGSDVQSFRTMQLLGIALRAWKANVEEAHKKNKVDYNLQIND